METNSTAKVERIILRHLSGSKAGHEEVFDVNQLQELTIGRHPSSSVQYDEAKDDLVSGQHARITQEAADATAFTLTDLGSRNGLYVDKQRVINAVRLIPGNVIQLGAGGPEFEFDLDPRPAGQLKKTRARRPCLAPARFPKHAPAKPATAIPFRANLPAAVTSRFPRPAVVRKMLPHLLSPPSRTSANPPRMKSPPPNSAKRGGKC